MRSSTYCNNETGCYFYLASLQICHHFLLACWTTLLHYTIKRVLRNQYIYNKYDVQNLSLCSLIITVSSKPIPVRGKPFKQVTVTINNTTKIFCNTLRVDKASWLQNLCAWLLIKNRLHHSDTLQNKVFLWNRAK